MSSDIAIKVENLSKCYQIYDQPRDRLKQFVMPRICPILSLPSKKYFREFWALRDVSFEVKKGETVGIIGRNGSGKSTLLQMICGTLNPTAGSIQTSGRIAALLELGSGFNPEFTGRENVYMNAAVLGLSQDEIDARFDDIAAFADIGYFLDQPVRNYSSGMVVRLAFAVQAMIDPDILVVDEALAVGDEKFQRKCFARLEELKGKGASILFVSHSAPSIIELCEKTLLVDKGIRIMYGEAQQVVRAYQKLIYAPAEEYKRLIQEYCSADHLGEVINTDNYLSVVHESTKSTSTTFDPGLVPETTTVYPCQGAEIQSIAVLDQHGYVVNVLQPGENYNFEMVGRFLNDLNCIYFGTHIKSITGVEITGQRYPEEGTYLEHVRANSEFRIRFSFCMNLMPGIYFVGGGVWSTQEPHCAHRIVDSLMFRVSPHEKQRSFGYVDLAINVPVLEIESN